MMTLPRPRPFLGGLLFLLCVGSIAVAQPGEVSESPPNRKPIEIRPLGETTRTDTPENKERVAPSKPNEVAPALAGEPESIIQPAVSAVPAETFDGPVIIPRAGTVPMGNSYDPSGMADRYADIYASIPFNRQLLQANPTYRHEATLAILFGQLPPTAFRQGYPYQPQTGTQVEPKVIWYSQQRDLLYRRYLSAPYFAAPALGFGFDAFGFGGVTGGFRGLRPGVPAIPRVGARGGFSASPTVIPRAYAPFGP